MANLTYVNGGGVIEHPAPYSDPRSEAVWLLARIDATDNAWKRLTLWQELSVLNKSFPFISYEMSDLKAQAQADSDRISHQEAAYRKFMKEGTW